MSRNWRSLSSDEIERRRSIILECATPESAAQQLEISVTTLGYFRIRYMPAHRWAAGRRRYPAWRGTRLEGCFS